MRVKLLEAFASGIPAVSTSLGAEGITGDGGPLCEIADTPQDFAAAVLRLLASREHACRLAAAARRFVESQMDGAVITRRLLDVYRREAIALRTTTNAMLR